MNNVKILENRASFIKEQAAKLGFLNTGISKAELLEEEAKNLEQWLSNNHHAKMSYLENHFDLRVDPSKLVPGAKSVISLSYNYYNPIKQSDPNAPKISMYAYGKDYHKIIKKKLKSLLHIIQDKYGDIHGRCFVDSAPLLERDLAKKGGLGWTGKNTLLLNKKQGSYFFLAEIVLDLEIEVDKQVLDHCGTCTKCIDACPTDAIHESGYILDASKCISYLTIELKDQIPTQFSDKMENWMFGCDICQEVCPWNRFSSPHQEEKFKPKDQLLQKTKSEWEEITLEVFDNLFEGSPVKRTKFEGLKRNIEFLSKE